MTEIQTTETTKNSPSPARRGNPNMIKGGPSTNPAGRPASGVQAFKDRLAYYVETRTLDDIKELIASPKKMGKLSMLDVLIVQKLYDAAQSGSGDDFNRIIDRLVGKPTQAITGADGAALIPQETNMHELARRTAFLLSLGAVDVMQSPTPIASPAMIDSTPTKEST